MRVTSNFTACHSAGGVRLVIDSEKCERFEWGPASLLSTGEIGDSVSFEDSTHSESLETLEPEEFGPGGLACERDSEQLPRLLGCTRDLAQPERESKAKPQPAQSLWRVACCLTTRPSGR